MKVLDNMLLNLKIISKIPENGRIKRSELGTIALDNRVTLNWLRRSINRDSRKRSIDDINSTIEFSIEKCNDIINSKYFEEHHIHRSKSHSFISRKIDDEYIKQYEILETIHNELKRTLAGLINLKTTYYEDMTSVSRIDIIISKIRNYTSELEKRIIKIDIQDIH